MPKDEQREDVKGGEQNNGSERLAVGIASYQTFAFVIVPLMDLTLFVEQGNDKNDCNDEDSNDQCGIHEYTSFFFQEQCTTNQK